VTTVTLKNGAEEAKALVETVYMCLSNLIEDHPIAFYELVMKCRDGNHELFGNTSTVLSQFAMIQHDGSVHGSIRNIVLSAVQGSGLDMTLSSPVAEEK